MHFKNHFRIFLCGFFVLILAGCASGGGRFSTPYAAGYHAPAPISCVPFARDASRMNIRGDAHTWWHQAPHLNYPRGYTPAPGAVMVLAQTDRLRHGHLAVVTRVLGRRHIDVTHSNWGGNHHTRSVIYQRHRVEDISPANDWSLVRFWNHHTGSFGQPYAVYGFIYQR